MIYAWKKNFFNEKTKKVIRNFDRWNIENLPDGYPKSEKFVRKVVISSDGIWTSTRGGVRLTWTGKGSKTRFLCGYHKWMALSVWVYEVVLKKTRSSFQKCKDSFSLIGLELQKITDLDPCINLNVLGVTGGHTTENVDFYYFKWCYYSGFRGKYRDYLCNNWLIELLMVKVFTNNHCFNTQLLRIIQRLIAQSLQNLASVRITMPNLACTWRDLW